MIRYRSKRKIFSEDVIDDVFDSSMYQQLESQYSGVDSTLITIDLLFDGGEKWLDSSIWVGNCVINEFPKEIRFNIEFTLFLFFSERKLPFKFLLSPLIKELLELESGFFIESGGRKEKFKLLLFSPVADKMAIFELLNMVSPQAFYSCNSCYGKGMHGSLKYLVSEDYARLRTLDCWKIDVLIFCGIVSVSIIYLYIQKFFNSHIMYNFLFQLFIIRRYVKKNHSQIVWVEKLK
jgi:hypothetical protein